MATITLNNKGNHNLAIPRMYFEYDPERIGEQAEFSIAIPKVDIEAAVPLAPKLDYLPEPSMGFFDTLVESPRCNEGGELSLQDDGDMVTARFGFTPLPEETAIPTGMEFANWRDRRRYLQTSREPFFKGRHLIFERVADIASLQYQFALPPSAAKTDTILPPSRFSFSHGMPQEEPRVIIGEVFENTRKSITKPESDRLTADLARYLKYLDPSKTINSNNLPVGVTIPAPYQIYGNGGESALGQLGDRYTQAEIIEFYPDRDYRLQDGDTYLADGHNLDLLPDHRTITMVAIGSINRICRERRIAKETVPKLY